MTDWNREADELGTSNFWKPETGTYKVKFLDDGKPTTYKDQRTGRETEQVDFKQKGVSNCLHFACKTVRFAPGLTGFDRTTKKGPQA